MRDCTGCCFAGLGGCVGYHDASAPCQKDEIKTEERILTMTNHEYTADALRKCCSRKKFKCTFFTYTLDGGAIIDCTEDVIGMLLQAAAMCERCEALIKKHTVDKYVKCKKCRSAINGRPRSFRGEPCYWHIDCGLDEHHFSAGSTEDKIVRILKYIIRGNAAKRKGETKYE